MKQLAPLLLTLAFGALVPVSASSEEGEKSINAVLPGCKRFLATAHGGKSSVGLQLFREGVCVGIVSTALEYQEMLDPKYKSCPPKGTTLGQAMEVVVKSLDAMPEYWRTDFRPLVITILRLTWPCL
jgi:hypothetical protein